MWAFCVKLEDFIDCVIAKKLRSCKGFNKIYKKIKSLKVFCEGLNRGKR